MGLVPAADVRERDLEAHARSLMIVQTLGGEVPLRPATIHYARGRCWWRGEAREIERRMADANSIKHLVDAGRGRDREGG